MNHSQHPRAHGPTENEYSLREQTAAPPVIIPAIGSTGDLFPIEKMQAHRRGVLHQAVSVFIFSGNELLIQRRAAGKYHCGRLWANSCCTHPHWGETLKDAAERRTYEELGVSIVPTAASVITYFAAVTEGLFEHERVQVFEAKVDKTHLRLAPNPNEVMDTRFVSRSILRDELRKRPDTFAPWFRIYLERWDELGLTAQ